ncbi:MAG: sel1 repeat family protein [Betaproteobacteria bacterium]|nr:sel1 repeat family protein [Betaproteobacteria bacterium]
MLTKIHINLLKNQADAGDLNSQLELAKIFKEGKGVEPSFSNTLKYYSMAARKNHPEALFFIAECQDKGKGMPLSPEYAFQNYLKAAKQGHVEACIAVGHFYELGRAAFKDLTKARQFYEYAVSKGSKEAKVKLQNLLSRASVPLSSVSPLERIKSQR